MKHHITMLDMPLCRYDFGYHSFLDNLLVQKVKKKYLFVHFLRLLTKLGLVSFHSSFSETDCSIPYSAPSLHVAPESWTGQV